MKFGSGEDENGNPVVDKTFESDIEIVSAVLAFGGPTFDRAANRRHTTLRSSDCFDKMLAAAEAYHEAHRAWVACFGGKRVKKQWGIEAR